MEDEMIMGIVFMVLIVLPTIIGGMILIALKILKGNKTKVSSAASVDETKMIQEIYHSLSRMEERVNTLETILLEREGKLGEKQ
jgi:phage shock protein B